MYRRAATILGVMTLAVSPLLADFSYQQTSTITGGLMASLLKIAGVFSKQAREPIRSTIAVKGDRMAHRSATSASIIDLASQTITHIDLQKKTYSVVTFDEMKQTMEQASQRMQQHKKADQPDVSFKVSVKDTGKTRPIAGFDTKEMILKMEMQSTDPESGKQGSMVITTDMWIAPVGPGYREIRDFYRRMAEKMSWTPDGNMFMSRPDVAEGMAAVYKEVSKLDGAPIFETIIMGGAEQAGATTSASAPPPQQQQQQQQADRPSVSGAVGGALAGKFGLGKKKSADQPADQQQSQQPRQSSSAPGSLLEMTTELSAFSPAPVDSALFEVPAGFKKVEANTRRGQ